MWHSVARDTKTAALETLAYFAELSYPLTALEIWQYSFFTSTYDEVVRALDELTRLNRVTAKDGKWTLAGSEAGFAIREERYRSSLRKLRRATRAVRYLRLLGCIRAVYACNTLSFMSAREESDIDLFIIVKHGTIWQSRLLVVIPFILLGLRVSARDERDGLCFSFFLSGKNLDLRRFQITASDPYLAFWAASLLPLYDPDAMANALREASGLTTLFPQLAQFPSPKKGTRSRFSMHVPFSEAIEPFLRRLQMARFPRQILEKNGTGTDVVLSDETLKFHTVDRRAEIRDRFCERLRSVGLSI